ncbi:c-type cytochrome biogenesis protein CcmI [Methylopila sp. M107]|uniref:c-type cytochrome biogenesis protein CcmI n=1 Tax=Methylopila sp. M107 TaxID=1101190 RepID=UPI00037FED62|nr:c-type cytochrome biogenesis protein CcmI [Methylopila sp. M107]
MALWLIFAVMTGAAVFVVLGSLARGRDTGSDAVEADAAVYRDQIAEIGRDRARGLIDEREAEGARVEVARRLLAATDREEAAAAAGSTARRRIAAVVALVAVPAIGLGVYGKLGQPDLPDLPLSARLNEKPDAQNLGNLALRVEKALEANPNDGRGWAVVGPLYMRLGRPSEAANAFANAIRILGSTPDREADLGEALFAAGDGVVTADARAAFERSVAGEQPSAKGAFYLARASEQDGDVAGAVARLKPLLAKAPDEAPYLDALKGELQRIAAVPQLPPPSPEQAASIKTPDERMAFVRKMVDGLSERLAQNGGDVGEWLRLVNARAALGDVDKAREALTAAREKFASDASASTRLEALALGLGLEGRGA